jgi:hypothetical protein
MKPLGNEVVHYSSSILTSSLNEGNLPPGEQPPLRAEQEAAWVPQPVRKLRKTLPEIEHGFVRYEVFTA